MDEVKWYYRTPAPPGCPRSFKNRAIIDGVEVWRNLKSVWIALKGLNMTAWPKRGQTLDDVARAVVADAIQRGDAIVLKAPAPCPFPTADAGR